MPSPDVYQFTGSFRAADAIKKTHEPLPRELALFATQIIVMHINYEFKAYCADLQVAQHRLLECDPLFIGTDRQVDTYFNVPAGRLKLREGNIENALIHYQRTNTAGAKQSDVGLYQHRPDATLKEVLTKALGIKVIIDKERKIYFIDNVKFHFDSVKELGTFLEVEAIDKDESLGVEKLKEQCRHYAKLLGVEDKDYIAESYSDLLLAKKSSIG
jgi:adenylate cyclase class 2